MRKNEKVRTGQGIKKRTHSIQQPIQHFLELTLRSRVQIQATRHRTLPASKKIRLTSPLILKNPKTLDQTIITPQKHSLKTPSNSSH